MQVVWSRNAINNITAIRAYIAEDDPSAASRIAARILEAGNALEVFPDRGRGSDLLNFRELIVVGTPYVLVYQVVGETVEIASIWHTSQNWG